MRLERYYGTALQPNGHLSKPVKILAGKHLKWLREQVCVATGAPGVDAHHVQLKSAIQNDYLTVPLRHDVHMQLHQEGVAAVEQKHGIDIKDALIAKLVERIWLLEQGNR